MSTAVAAGAMVEARVLENFVDGAWVPARTSERVDVTNPATCEILARVPLSGRDDVEAAVAAARAALPGWRIVSQSTLVATPSSTRPCIVCGIAVAASTISIARSTSARASPIVLPISRVTDCARSSERSTSA